MFDEKSRYKGVPTYQIPDRQGKTVTVVGDSFHVIEHMRALIHYPPTFSRVHT